MNKLVGYKKSKEISKINDDYIAAMISYMGEKDRKKKLKKAEEALIIQAKIAPLAYKMLILGLYYWGVYILFNAWFGGTELLPGLNWAWTMIVFAILMFLLKKTNTFDFHTP